MRPKAFIFEALMALDENSTVKVKNFIHSFTTSGGGVLIVEHDERNLDIADRVLRMVEVRVFEVTHG